MELPKACTRCGGTDLEPGELNNPNSKISFHLAKSSWFTFTSPLVQVTAVMCLDCGAIELTGDVTKAREIAKK